MAQDNMKTLSLEPKSSVVEIYNEANDTKLLNDDALLRLREASLEDAEGTLAARSASSVFDDVPYAGRVDISWKRLDLGLFFGFALDIPLDLPTDTVLLLDELQRRTGLRIDHTDVVLERIDWPVARRYKLKAQPTSMRWFGEVEINLLRLIHLDKVLPPPVDLGDWGEELDPEHWVLEYGGDLNGNRFTALWRALVAPVVLDEDVAKEPLIKAFQDILIQRDLITRWVSQEAVVANNLYGAVVIDNGPVPDHLPKHYHANLTHCVRLLPSPFYCSSPAGIVTVLYNPNHTPGKEQ